MGVSKLDYLRSPSKHELLFLYRRALRSSWHPENMHWENKMSNAFCIPSNWIQKSLFFLLPVGDGHVTFPEIAQQSAETLELNSGVPSLNGCKRNLD